MGGNRWTTVGSHKQTFRSSSFADVAKWSVNAVRAGDSRTRGGRRPLPYPQFHFSTSEFVLTSQLGHRNRFYDGSVLGDGDEVVVPGDPARPLPDRRGRRRRGRLRQRGARTAHRAEVELGGRRREGRVTLPAVTVSGPPIVSVDRRRRLDFLVVVHFLREPLLREARPRCRRKKDMFLLRDEYFVEPQYLPVMS